jgi:DNA-binding NtrC family response regulator
VTCWRHLHSGAELAERTRDLYPHLPVVLMAGPNDPNVDELREGYTDWPFLVKPVHFSDLAATLERLAGIPARETEPRSTTRPRARRRRTSGQHPA